MIASENSAQLGIERRARNLKILLVSISLCIVKVIFIDAPYTAVFNFSPVTRAVYLGSNCAASIAPFLYFTGIDIWRDFLPFKGFILDPRVFSTSLRVDFLPGAGLAAAISGAACLLSFALRWVLPLNSCVDP